MKSDPEKEMEEFNDLLKQLLKAPPQKDSEKSDHKTQDINEEAS